MISAKELEEIMQEEFGSAEDVAAEMVVLVKAENVADWGDNLPDWAIPCTQYSLKLQLFNDEGRVYYKYISM